MIASPAGDSFRVVDSFSRIIRLGEGISATGSISEAAIERAIAALSICSDKIRFRKAKRLRLIATEACRAAANADRFRDRVAAETGIRLEVIDRETEATLAVIGCSPLLDQRGGAPSCSTSAAARPNWSGSSAIRTSRSAAADQGVDVDPARRRLAGRAFRRQGRHAGILCADGREVAQYVAPFAAEHGADLRDMHMLGTSGTVTTLAGVHLNLARYDRRRIDGIWMNGPTSPR